MTSMELSYNQVPTPALEQALALAEAQRRYLEEQLLAAQVSIQAIRNVIMSRV